MSPSRQPRRTPGPKKFFLWYPGQFSFWQESYCTDTLHRHMITSTACNPLVERYRCEDHFGYANARADLPYDAWQAIHNLRLERYVDAARTDWLVKLAYYLLRP